MIGVNSERMLNLIMIAKSVWRNVFVFVMIILNCIRKNGWGRLGVWLAILLVGMTAACLAIGDGGVCLYAYMYPLGFDYAVFDNHRGIVSGCLGYSVYIGLLAGFLLFKQLRVFSILCAVMVFVCALNSYGCHKMMKEFHGSDSGSSF